MKKYPEQIEARTGSIIPMHRALEMDRVDMLTTDMRSRGWVGRPLLVELSGDGYRAWTGSHRLAAAMAAGLESVPVVVIDDEGYDLIVDEYGEPGFGRGAASLLSDDEERAKGLRRVGLTAAAELMEMENQD